MYEDFKCSSLQQICLTYYITDLSSCVSKGSLFYNKSALLLCHSEGSDQCLPLVSVCTDYRLAAVQVGETYPKVISIFTNSTL